MLNFLLFSIFVPTCFTQFLCSNGAKASELCKLVPTSGYECTNTNSTGANWCENINGTYRCCQKTETQCMDRSEFCRFTKHLCHDKSSFKTMKSKCEASCGFCDIESYEDAIALRQRIEKLARKCVFPREKMLTTTSTTTTTAAPKTNETSSNATLSNSQSTVTVPRGFLATTMKRRNIPDSSTSKISLPNVTTAQPSLLTTSLKKTLIKGKCFDEYVYCQEFASLCSHPKFSEAMAFHCSLTCDRCNDVIILDNKIEDENCVDKSENCSENRDLCNRSEYSEIMREYCPKSCELCNEQCKDRHKSCDQFKLDGFCEDEMYSKEERTHLCGRSCNYC